MAVYTVANGGGNINAGATYVGGIAPSSTDTIDFTATSGQLTVNTIFTIAGIDFTNYVNTLTMSAVLSVNGNVTLVAGMTITGASGLTVSTTATLTSNGKTWPNNLTFSGTSQTYTLADNWTVNGTFSVGNSIVNGNIINLVGNLSVTASMTSRGTTVMNFAGTSTWTGNVYLRNSITVNGNLTLSSGGVGLRDNVSFTYVSGTFNATTCPFTVNDNVTFNNVSSITFYRVDFGSTTQTTTLNSDLYVSFQVTISNAVNTINGNNIYLSGSLSMGHICQGTTQINLIGTGTWSGAGVVRNNLTINTAGTITVSGIVYYNTGTLTYTSGTVVTTDSVLAITSSCTLNTGVMNWNNITTSATNPSVTLLSDLNISGNLTTSASSQSFNGLFNINVSKNLTIGGTSTLGTAQLNLIGIGTWSAGLGTTMALNTTIKSSANIILGSLITYNTGTLTIEKQAIITTRTNSSLTISNTCTLTNIDKCKFKNVTVTAGVTLTMNKFFSGSPEIKTVVRSSATSNYTITFTDRVPKKAYFVNVKNCTVTQTTTKNQLNIIGRDSNAGFNTGIIFGEAGLNGFPLNQYGTDNSYSFTDGFSQGGMNN